MLPDVDLIPELVGGPARAAPFKRLAIEAVGEAFDDDDRQAAFETQEPGIGPGHGLDRERFRGGGDHLTAILTLLANSAGVLLRQETHVRRGPCRYGRCQSIRFRRKPSALPGRLSRRAISSFACVTNWV